MKISPAKIINLITVSFVIFCLFSCSKDSDLLADYVSIEGKDGLVSNRFVVNDSYFISANSSSMVLDVLANDNFENPDQVKITETSVPKNGTVEINIDYTITYTVKPGEPATTEAAEDTFTYTAEVTNDDNTVTSEEGTVTVNNAAANQSSGALKAFPAAYGGGSQATGGRGGQVIHVTNLNDDGPGSFRAAFQTPGPRIIVFDVSGTINLSSSMRTSYDDVTVAGQTAPAGGITFTGVSPNFEISGRNNMIFRYIRVRPRFVYTGGNQSSNSDAVQFAGCTNIIFDHCSVSWAGDEAVDITGASQNNTIQNTIMAESYTGMLMGNSNSNTGGAAVSFNNSALGNLYFQIDHRHPNTISWDRVDQINQVIWGYGGRLNRPAPGSPQLNEINNYYMADAPRPLYNMNKIDYYSAAGRQPQIYTKGNLHLPQTVTDQNLVNNNNTWTVFGTSDGAHGFTYNGVSYIDDDAPPSDFFVSSQWPLIGDDWPIMSALDAFQYAKTEMGANKRIDGNGNVISDVDAIDQYYLGHINAGTMLQTGGQFQMAGKQHYEAFHNNVSNSPINVHPSGYDSDRDGIPDVWENAMFGDLSRNGQGDFDSDGYTDLEEYLNLVDF